MSEPIYCISCDERLPPLDPKDDQHNIQPRHWLVVYARGNYGSSVFDPCDDTKLEMHLCDACTLAKSARIWRVTPKELNKAAFERFDRVLGMAEEEA